MDTQHLSLKTTDVSEWVTTHSCPSSLLYKCGWYCAGTEVERPDWRVMGVISDPQAPPAAALCWQVGWERAGSPFNTVGGCPARAPRRAWDGAASCVAYRPPDTLPSSPTPRGTQAPV